MRRPMAAAYNLQHSGNPFLQRALCTGASLQSIGYDEPLALTLREQIADRCALNAAVAAMADAFPAGRRTVRRSNGLFATVFCGILMCDADDSIRREWASDGNPSSASNRIQV